jgi:type IV secretory pathway VirB9-like protein
MATAKKEVKKAEPAKKAAPAKKAEPAKKVAPKKAAPVKETPKAEEPKKERKRIERYHISQDPKDKKWRVFLAGSDKVIKKFDTQLQAYGYAQNLSDNNDRGIVVHSKKGKIRKM